MPAGRRRKHGNYNFNKRKKVQPELPRDSIEEQPDPTIIDIRSDCPLNDDNQPTTSTRPSRAAKVKCIETMSDNIIEINVQQREENKEQIRQLNRKRIAGETDEERRKRLKELRKRASQRIATETNVQRIKRLKNIRDRASQRREEVYLERTLFLCTGCYVDFSHVKTQSSLKVENPSPPTCNAVWKEVLDNPTIKNVVNGENSNFNQSADNNLTIE